MESILNEVADLVAKGYKEVTLLGQNVNSYRFEKPDGETITFPMLLRTVQRQRRAYVSVSLPRTLKT